MASLVTPLANGFPGAPSGTAQFFQTGTGTLANVYSDPLGVTAVTTHALDARGAIVRYVEDRTDVVVRDVNAALVKAFTTGGDARDVMVENAGFTGVNDLGATVAGGRTTLDLVLSRLYASSGAVDGLVRVAGANIPLQAALAATSAVFFVVTGYGAVGDGVVNDQLAVQAAVTAAAAAGGGTVVFPGGTYKLSSVVTVAANVSLLGLGLVTISDSGFGFSAATTNRVENLAFTATGNVVSVTGGARVTCINCTFPPSGASVGIAAAHASADVTCILCRFTIAASGAKAGNATVSGARTTYISCSVSHTTASSTTVFDGTTGTTVAVTDCRWVSSGASSGCSVIGSPTYGRILGGVFDYQNAAGSYFLMAGSAGTYLSIVGATIQTVSGVQYYLGFTGLNLTESGCSFIGAGTIIALVSGARSQYRNSLSTAVTQTWVGTINTINAQTRLAQYTFNTGGGGSTTFAAPAQDSGMGDDFTLVIKNTSGSTQTFTWAAAWVVPTGFTSIANNITWRLMFIRTGAAEYTCTSSQAT